MCVYVCLYLCICMFSVCVCMHLCLCIVYIKAILNGVCIYVYVLFTLRQSGQYPLQQIYQHFCLNHCYIFVWTRRITRVDIMLSGKDNLKNKWNKQYEIFWPYAQTPWDSLLLEQQEERFPVSYYSLAAFKVSLGIIFDSAIFRGVKSVEMWKIFSLSQARRLR